jgi:hypothetical protein
MMGVTPHTLPLYEKAPLCARVVRFTTAGNSCTHISVCMALFCVLHLATSSQHGSFHHSPEV